MNLSKVGENYEDFQVTRVVELPEIQCTLRELIHQPTGAQVMHLENEDPENVFCLSFKTLPNSSNGVAHILEHTVLCGSEKFPVKDPFFGMTRRSLNTFMNAFTGSDFTCYPAASQVPKDFYNLLEVYLDAVFKPRLLEQSFLQEGHRLEFSDPEDPSSQLEFKGIVFNEMKGALAVPDSRLTEALYETLFPDLTYGVNAGGNPKNIPDLTYQQLKDFHSTYYHPSRCLFYFYGNMPLKGHLDFITKQVLNGFKKENPLPPIPKQKRFTHSVKREVPYPIPTDQETKEQSIISFGWLTCNILEQVELLALSVLNLVLMGTDAAPLKMALLKSGLCKKASGWMDNDITEIPFVITLRGCDPENADPLEKVIHNTLEKIVKEGIPQDLIENAIHQVEFHRSEITGDGAPYGLSLFMRAGLLKQQGSLPEDGLRVHSLCDTLRNKDPSYFASLIKKYYLENPHAVQITLYPDKELAAKELQEEKAKLEETRSRIDPSQVVAKAKELATFQKEQETKTLDLLPRVSLDDVPEKGRNYPLTEKTHGNLHVYHHETFTNKIVYTDLIFPIPAIAEEELPFVQLFALLLPQVGCGGRGYAETLGYIQAHTGGIAATTALNRHVTSPEQFSPYFFIHGKALHRKVDKLFPLIQEMITSADFTDVERLKEVITKHYAGLQSALISNALKYAMNLSASGLNVPSRIAKAWGGLEYYWAIRDLAHNFDKMAETLVARLQSLQERMLGLEGAHLVLTCDREMRERLEREHFYGLESLPSKKYEAWKDRYPIEPVRSQGRIIASPVAFTCHTIPSESYLHPDTPALTIASQLFDNLTLHTEIREKGGAYGGGAANQAMSGAFCFYSYRDPNISQTLDVFRKSVDHVLQGNFTDSDLEEAKLEIFQSLDSPVSPGSRGHIAYTWMREGKTFEVRQKQREQYKQLTREDVIEAVAKHIKPKLETGTTVVFAGNTLLEKENPLLKRPLKIEQV